MADVIGYNYGKVFFRALSDFWTVVYKDTELLRKFMDGYGELFSQAYFNFIETILGTSIEQIPVFSRRKWYFLEFLESENLATGFLEYGQGAVYGPQPTNTIFDNPGGTFLYGDTATQAGLFKFKLPEPMVNISRYIMNRIHAPSMMLVKDHDFIIDDSDHSIIFQFDPFATDLIATRDIRDENGNVIDRAIGMWALNSDWDFEYVFRNYGSLIDFYKPNSESYKLFVRAIWDLFVNGPNIMNVKAGVNAVLGMPISRDFETIETIINKDGKNIIVTDKNSFEVDDDIPLRADFFDGMGNLRPDVELEPFEPLTDTVFIRDSVSDPFWWRDIDPLVIPWNFTAKVLATDEQRDFFLPDIDILGEVVIGATWGLPEEFRPINDYFRTMGMRVGDFIIGTDTLPNGLSVPVTIKFNFKDFVMENFFSHNLFLMQISSDVVERTEFSQQIIRIIQQALPVYVTFLNITELPQLVDEYELFDEVSTPFIDAGVYTAFDGLDRARQGNNSDYEQLDVGKGIELDDEMKPAQLLTTAVPNAANTSANSIIHASGYSHPTEDTTYTLEVTTAGALGTAVFTVTDTGTDIAPAGVLLPTVAGQLTYAVGTRSLTIILENITDTFDIGDTWLIDGFAFDDAVDAGYVAGHFGPPAIGFITIGAFTIGSKSFIFNETLLVQKVCVV